MKAPYRERLRQIPPPEGDALSHGLAMASVPVVFGLLGWWVDSLVGTGPIVLIALAVFGVASSFASAYYRYEQKISRHDEGKPWMRKVAS